MKLFLLILSLFSFSAFAQYDLEIYDNEITISQESRDALAGEHLLKTIFDICAEPYYVNEKIHGFQLFEPSPGSIFEQVGIQDGDIVLSIENVPLNSPTVAVDLLSQVKYQDDFTFRILRDGVERQFRVKVK